MTTPKQAPGPRGDLLLGSMLDLKEKPHEFVRYVARAYGDVARFKIGWMDWFLVTDPALVWDVVCKRQDLFLKPKIAHKLWKPFLGDGLLTAEGAFWKRHNGMMRPAFHRSRIEAYGEVMVDYTRRMLDDWKGGEERDVHDDMTGLTLEIVAKTLFDADVREGAPVVGAALLTLQEVILEHLYMPLPIPKWWPSETNKRKHEAIEDIAGIVRGVIDERRRDGVDRGDLLSMLVFAEADDGDRMTDKELFDESMTLFFAGHETTANSLTWAVYLLARYPEVTAKVQAELRTVVGDRPITVADCRDLPYLDKVVKESMRILPSVWVFMKEPTEDTEIGGFHVPKGAQIMLSPWVMQHDERWFPNPETFDPERFSKERAAEIPRGAYMPFSGGNRVCLGRNFALMEMRLILGTIAQLTNPRIPEGHRPEQVAELSMHPRDGMPIIVEMRDEVGGADALGRVPEVVAG